MDWNKELKQVIRQADHNALLEATRARLSRFTDDLDTLTAMGIKMRQEAEEINKALEEFNAN